MLILLPPFVYVPTDGAGEPGEWERGSMADSLCGGGHLGRGAAQVADAPKHVTRGSRGL